MKKRIAMWTAVGLLGAGLWVALLYATNLEQFLFIMAVPVLRTLLYASCPVMYVAQYCPIKLWGAVLTNAAMFALLGLMVEMLRAKLRQRVAT